MRRVAFAAAAALLALAGCSSEPPPTPEDDSNFEEPAPVATPAPEPRAEAPKEAPPPVETNDAVVDDVPVDDSARTQDDADAVGMTTRAPLPNAEDEETPAVGSNESGGE